MANAAPAVELLWWVSTRLQYLHHCCIGVNHSLALSYWITSDKTIILRLPHPKEEFIPDVIWIISISFLHYFSFTGPKWQPRNGKNTGRKNGLWGKNNIITSGYRKIRFVDPLCWWNQGVNYTSVDYHRISNISLAKSQNLNASRLG